MSSYVASLAARNGPPYGGKPSPLSWFITFGLGGPAGGTYTEVEFTPECVARLEAEATDPGDLSGLLDETVRQIACDLYGTAWAFDYRPDQYAGSIERFPVRLREHALVTEVSRW
jgi:hypothetical protein